MSVLEERYQMDLNEVQFQDADTIGQLEKLISQGTAPNADSNLTARS